MCIAFAYIADRLGTILYVIKNTFEISGWYKSIHKHNTDKCIYFDKQLKYLTPWTLFRQIMYSKILPCTV